MLCLPPWRVSVLVKFYSFVFPDETDVEQVLQEKGPVQGKHVRTQTGVVALGLLHVVESVRHRVDGLLHEGHLRVLLVPLTEIF